MDALSLCGDADLLHRDVWSYVASDEVQELHHMRPQQCICKLASGQRIRSKNSVCSRAAQLFSGLYLRSSGHDGQLWIKSFCGENNEEVLGIGGQCRDQSFRSENAGFAKAVILCGICGYGKHSCVRSFCNPDFVGVDDHKGSLDTLKLIRSVSAYAAKTTDNKMIM